MPRNSNDHLTQHISFPQKSIWICKFVCTMLPNNYSNYHLLGGWMQWLSLAIRNPMTSVWTAPLSSVIANAPPIADVVVWILCVPDSAGRWPSVRRGMRHGIRFTSSPVTKSQSRLPCRPTGRTSVCSRRNRWTARTSRRPSVRCASIALAARRTASTAPSSPRMCASMRYETPTDWICSQYTKTHSIQMDAYIDFSSRMNGKPMPTGAKSSREPLPTFLQKYYGYFLIRDLADSSTFPPVPAADDEDAAAFCRKFENVSGCELWWSREKMYMWGFTVCNFRLKFMLGTLIMDHTICPSPSTTDCTTWWCDCGRTT